MEEAAQDAGAVAKIASALKSTKCVAMDRRYIFQPTAVESLGLIDNSATTLLDVLGRRIAEISGETQEDSFLLKRLSMLIQWFNTVLLHDSFVNEEAGTGIPAYKLL